MNEEQVTLFDDNPEYQAFVDKFKRKLTTDDCYTPPEVYEAVKEWACERCGIDPEKIVRPFYPGGDYENFDYSDGAVVVDNPPFSILAKIQKFYLDRGIGFFLFAPSLTCLGSKYTCMETTHIFCDANIEYENGAIVRTAFVTNLCGDVIVETAPDLKRKLEKVIKDLHRGKARNIPKYTYPDNVLTAAMAQKYAGREVKFSVRKSDCVHISKLDSQRDAGKALYGGGLLLSERAAAERAAAERAAAERAAAERAAAERAAAERKNARVWPLSKRERELIGSLGCHDA